MNDEITLKDLYEKLVRLEFMVAELLTKNNTDDIMIREEHESPFLNPETGLYDRKYYEAHLEGK